MSDQVSARGEEDLGRMLSGGGVRGCGVGSIGVVSTSLSKGSDDSLAIICHAITLGSIVLHIPVYHIGTRGIAQQEHHTQPAEHGQCAGEGVGVGGGELAEY